MEETPAQQRYRHDAQVLAEIGRHLTSQLEPATLRLPARLAAKAALAWSRDELDPAGPESGEQAVVRSFAATLALIGLAVEQQHQAGDDDIVVTLAPEQIAGALFAAERVPATGETAS